MLTFFILFVILDLLLLLINIKFLVNFFRNFILILKLYENSLKFDTLNTLNLIKWFTFIFNPSFSDWLCATTFNPPLLSTHKLCMDVVRRTLFAYCASFSFCVRTKISQMAYSFRLEHTSSVSHNLWVPSRVCEWRTWSNFMLDEWKFIYKSVGSTSMSINVIEFTFPLQYCPSCVIEA